MQKLYTMEEVAELLGVSKRTVRREVEDGKLGFRRIRLSTRFAESDVQQYLKNAHQSPIGSKEQKMEEAAKHGHRVQAEVRKTA